MDISINRIHFLNIPVDAGKPEAVMNTIEHFLLDGQGHQIVLLTIRKLLKAKFDPALQRCLRQSSLILPVSKGIIRGAHFQKKPPLSRYNPFEFVIRLLSLAERLDRSVYLLGALTEELEQAEKNLKTSFPELKVVGRYSGYFDKPMEQNVILAIRKSSPAFLLVGKGVRDKDKWIDQNRKSFNPGVFLWIDNCFEIFSGKERNVSKRLFNLGLEHLSGIIRKPWKIFGFLYYLYFKFLVLVFKIRGL